MFNKFKLKPARTRDVKGIARLFAAIPRRNDHEKIKKLIREKRVFVLKDKKKNKIHAAFSYTVIGIAGFFAIMYIHRFAVAPELQGQGVGTFLLSRIRKISVKMGAFAFLLYSVEKAKRFYEKNKLNRIWRYFYWKKESN